MPCCTEPFEGSDLISDRLDMEVQITTGIFYTGNISRFSLILLIVFCKENNIMEI